MRRGGLSTYYACREDLPENPQAALGLAMMAGALAGFLALRVLVQADLPADRKQAMLDVQLGVTTDTVIGQILDLERDVTPSADEGLLETVCEYKTARYSILAPLRLGLPAAGEGLAQYEESLRRYAALAGISGQMRDDYLDLFGDPDLTGKPIGADLRAGRLTYLVRDLLAATSAEEHNTVKAALGSPDCTSQTIDRIRDIAYRRGVHHHPDPHPPRHRAPVVHRSSTPGASRLPPPHPQHPCVTGSSAASRSRDRRGDRRGREGGGRSARITDR
ncbi:polyprenyl synthetase family protein [Streptomyces sp. NPDC002092]